MKFRLTILGAAILLLASCNNNETETGTATTPEVKTETTTVLEVTTFKLASTAEASTFNELDAAVEGNFTSQQPGFIKRQSGVTEEGEYVVLVYWNSTADADASMQKFMSDASVADYASMIDGATMKMSRYSIDEDFDAKNSTFVEVMSFDTKEDTDLDAFNKINKAVETGFTAKQTGFLQRITGANDEGRQVVAIYWDTKSNSDVALEPFMENEIAKEFMGMMDQASMVFGRYQTLTSLED